MKQSDCLGAGQNRKQKLNKPKTLRNENVSQLFGQY